MKTKIEIRTAEIEVYRNCNMSIRQLQAHRTTIIAQVEDRGRGMRLRWVVGDRTQLVWRDRRAQYNHIQTNYNTFTL